MNFRALMAGTVVAALAAAALVAAPTRAQAPTQVRAAYIPVITWLPALVGNPVTGSTITFPVAESLT